MAETRSEKVHKLKNMLAIVINYSLVLENGTDKSDPLAADLAELKTAAQRALQITKELFNDDKPRAVG